MWVSGEVEIKVEKNRFWAMVSTQHTYPLSCLIYWRWAIDLAQEKMLNSPYFWQLIWNKIHIVKKTFKNTLVIKQLFSAWNLRDIFCFLVSEKKTVWTSWAGYYIQWEGILPSFFHVSMGERNVHCPLQEGRSQTYTRSFSFTPLST